MYVYVFVLRTRKDLTTIPRAEIDDRRLSQVPQPATRLTMPFLGRTVVIGWTWLPGPRIRTLVGQRAQFLTTNLQERDQVIQGGHTALKVLESPWNFFSIFPGPGKSLKME